VRARVALLLSVSALGCTAIFDIDAREARPRPDTGAPACGVTSCGDTCNDDRNCGACGNVCDEKLPAQRCISGICVDHRWPKGPLEESPTCSPVGTDGAVLYAESSGLYWTAKSVGQTISVEKGNQICAGLSFGDLTGFRLPTRAELIELVDYRNGIISTSCTKDEPKAAGRSYCSSSPTLSALYGIAWPDGTVGEAAIESMTPCFVRCVKATRGGPRGRFTQLPSGLIRDEVTRLDWQREMGSNPIIMGGDKTFFTWDAAQDHCAEKGMRLPTAKQLMSLVAEGAPPTIDPIFPSTAADFFWTETQSTDGQTYELVVDFARGFSSVHPRVEVARVRCVQNAPS